MQRLPHSRSQHRALRRDKGTLAYFPSGHESRGWLPWPWQNLKFGTRRGQVGSDSGKTRGLVPRFLPTSAIWFPGSGETPGREKRVAPFRVPNLEIRPRAGTKPRILPRKGTEPPDFASISPSRGTKPPISAVLFFFIGYQIAHLARMPAKRGTKPRKLAQTTAGFALRRMHSTDA